MSHINTTMKLRAWHVRAMMLGTLLFIGAQFMTLSRLLQWPSITEEQVALAPTPLTNKKNYTMIILRAIGNALPPRHSPQQTLENLDFTLQYEILPPGTTRHWFVNKLVDPEVEEQVVARLRTANESFTVVPLDLKEYSQIPHKFEYLATPDMIHTKAFMETALRQQLRLEMDMHHERIVYVINVNGVRNDMLDYAEQHSSADYFALLDGNCFVTPRALDAIFASIRQQPRAKYFTSPTDRLRGPNTDLLNPRYIPNAIDEEQLIFHSSAKARFNARLRYGRRDKLELLNRLGLGDLKFRGWTAWEKPWITKRKERDVGKAGVPTAGWVSRLQSGNRKADQPTHRKMRGLLRAQAIPQLLEKLDLRAARELYNFSSWTLLYYNEEELKNMNYDIKQQVIQTANELLKDNGKKSDGMANMMRDTTILALAYSVTQESDYAKKAVEMLVQWFVEPTTRASPNEQRGMPDAIFFLDAVRMLETSGVLKDEMDVLRQWFRDYLASLLQSSQAPYVSPDYGGLYFDIQVISVAAFANDLTLAIRTMHRSMSRLQTHVDSKGNLSHELSKENCEQAQLMALQGWTILAHMSSSIGLDVWSRFPTGHSTLLCQAMEVADPLFRAREPCKGKATEDAWQWWPLAHEAKRHCPALATRELEQVEWFPHQNGVPSMRPGQSEFALLWNLGLTTTGPLDKPRETAVVV